MEVARVRAAKTDYVEVARVRAEVARVRAEVARVRAAKTDYAEVEKAHAEGKKGRGAGMVQEWAGMLCVRGRVLGIGKDPREASSDITYVSE